MALKEKLQDVMDRAVSDCVVAGMNLLVEKDGREVCYCQAGMADREEKRPMARDTVFRLYSQTKPVTAAAAMILMERGQMDLISPVSDFIPAFAGQSYFVETGAIGKEAVGKVMQPVQIFDLLRMTSGLVYPDPATPAGRQTAAVFEETDRRLLTGEDMTTREMAEKLAACTLAFEPGSRFLYGFSSELTAGLLEAVCGKPAETVIKEMLFEPLGMESSANFIFGDLSERLVKNYYLHPGRRLGEADAMYALTPEQDARFVGPLGSVSGFSRVITNCFDYTRLMQMLACGGIYNGTRIMGRKTIDLLRTNTLTETMLREDFTNDYLAGYGYGYGMRTLMDPYVGHHNGSVGAFGWTGGSGTWAEADPCEGVSIVYMHNLQPNLEEYHHLRMRAVAYGCLQ